MFLIGADIYRWRRLTGYLRIIENVSVAYFLSGSPPGSYPDLQNKVETSGLEYNEGGDKLTNSDGERTILRIETNSDGERGQFSRLKRSRQLSWDFEKCVSCRSKDLWLLIAAVSVNNNPVCKSITNVDQVYSFGVKTLSNEFPCVPDGYTHMDTHDIFRQDWKILSK